MENVYAEKEIRWSRTTCVQINGSELSTHTFHFLKYWKFLFIFTPQDYKKIGRKKKWVGRKNRIWKEYPPFPNRKIKKKTLLYVYIQIYEPNSWRIKDIYIYISRVRSQIFNGLFVPTKSSSYKFGCLSRHGKILKISIGYFGSSSYLLNHEDVEFSSFLYV